MSRGWPQGRPPWVDIWPDRAGGDHAPKIMKKKENKFFKWSKSFLSYSLVGWEWDSGDRRKCWGRGGWECTPKWQKMTKKWQNPMFVALKPCQWAILLYKNMYNTISIPRMHTVLCLGVCQQRNRSASPPQTRQKQQKCLKMAKIHCHLFRSKFNFLMHRVVKPNA